MKTELSHNKIALFKSKKPLRCISDHLIFCLLYYIFLPIALLLFLSPITSSPPTYSSLPPNVLSR